MPAIKLPSEELLSALTPGTWVAISPDQDRVTCSGQSLDEVLRKTSEEGEREPFTMRVPKNNSALIL